MVEHGVGRPEWIILFCLAQFDGMNAHEVSRVTGRARASVSRAVGKLARTGLITREADPEDARSTVLRLAPAGRRLFEKSLPLFVEREKAMLAVLTAPQLSALDRLLERLVKRADGWDAAY